jgi:hypothetical protein
MTRFKAAVVLMVAIVFVPVYVPAGDDLTDPYEIFARHYEAVGGLERFKAERTCHFEGKVSIFGMEGVLREWEEHPAKKRQELELPVFSYITGDNGEFSWVVDQNGKLQIKKDETTLEKREVETLLNEYEHLNPASEVFTLTYEGIEPVGDEECYVIRIDNTIDQTVRRIYFRKSDFYQAKSVIIEPDHELHTVNSDWREVDGKIIPFRHEVEILPIGQAQVIEITTYESNVEIDPALFEPPAEEPEDFRFTNGTSAEKIPFEYLGDHIYLDVTVDCRERRWCLDSGAAVTVIDSAFAADLGLETQGETKGYGAGKTISLAFVEIPAFSLKGIDFDAQQGAALPIAGLFKKGGIEVAGILGYDFLSRFVTRIDFANREISFYHPESFEYGGPGSVIDAPLKENLFHLPMAVEEYSGEWALDIGASGGSFFYPYAVEHGFLERPGLEGLAGGAGGYFKIRTSEFGSIDLGGFELTDQLLSMPVDEGGVLGRSEGVGVLGNSILRHFVLYLDYERQRVVLEKGDDFGRDFPRGKTGLGLQMNDSDEMQVLYVSPGTPAEKAGFEPDDIVTSINGIGVEHLSGLLAVKELFEADAGTEYAIGIMRAGRSMILDLKLEDLF